MAQKLSQIKLIIWDLDETLWDGIVSEGSVKLKKGYAAFLRNTLDMGIVHAICSKNDFNVAKAELEKLGLWECFVFPSINWEAKGARIKRLIEDMALRPVNVLFVDDNPQNLNEAKYFSPGIMTMLPENVEQLFAEAEAAEKKDTLHKRLKQYQVLQEKKEEESHFASNEEFLYNCNIQVTVLEDCLAIADRLHELLIRSNQLNYTKVRPEKEEFLQILNDANVRCGYVHVKDRFGDYGVVGFFAIRENQLLHYVFSCRTLGMRVEQYVYMLLGCPKLEVVGDVVADLNTTERPGWINCKQQEDAEQAQAQTTARLLFKGPCDMQQIFSFIHESDDVHGEFSYTNPSGVLTEGHNHTAQIVTALEATGAEKAAILNGFSWLDKDSLDTKMITGGYDYVVLSMLTDGNLGLYRNRENGRYISLCEKYYDLTRPENWDKYINGEIFTSNIKFTREDLEKFAREYEFTDNTDGSQTLANLQIICNHLPKKTKLILLLGAQREFRGKMKPSYEKRHIFHQMLNEKIRIWAENKPNVELICLDKFVKKQSDFLDTINHFVKHVYYEVAQEILAVAKATGAIKKQGKLRLFYQVLLQYLRVSKRKISKKLNKH